MDKNALGNPCEKHSPFPKFIRKKTVALKDTCVLIMGQSPSSESYNINGEGLPFYQGNADFGEDNPTPRSWCTDPKKVAEKGDILISVRAPIGAINIANERCCIGRGIAAIRPNQDLMPTNYLRHQLSASRSKLEAMGTGSTFKAIGKKALSDFAVAIYSKSEQEAIVYQLDCIAAQIKAANNQLIRFDTLVKSRFVEMFNEVKQTSILEELIDPETRISYGIVQPGPEGTGDMGVLRPVDIADGRLCLDAVKKIDRAIGNSYRRTELMGDEILTIVRGATGQTVRSKVDCAGMNVTRGIAVIRHEPSLINPDYLVGYMNSDNGKRYIADHTQGATLQQINIADLRVMPIPVPPLALQQEFAAFVSQVDKLRFTTQQQIDKLETLKKSLMQEYFE